MSTTRFRSVEEQMEILMRGVVDIVSQDELRKKLAKSAATGKPLRVKLGIDPTGADLTLGHTVPLRKMKQFMELGHHCILIIGDYTAMVGDPTDRSEARPQLTHEQTTTNAARYLEQAGRVLDVSKLEVRRNSEWLGPMTFADVIRLASQATVARILEREDFRKRYEEGRAIYIHEFFYPLMQGHDSVAIAADVELGATEQKFNLLAGRDLQRNAGQEPQVCLMNPVVEGLDGVQKMSKSLGNYIGLNFPPEEMFGKTMSIPDHLIATYFTFFTDEPDAQIEGYKLAMAQGENPMNIKKRLGKAIVTTYGYSAEEAERAEEKWVAQFSRGELPEEIPDVGVIAGELPIGAARLLVATGLAASLGEARRLIEQGGFSIDGQKVTDPKAELNLAAGQVLKAGKRKYGRVVLQ
jgi:tyrosyl-tRNA synthetase